MLLFYSAVFMTVIIQVAGAGAQDLSMTATPDNNTPHQYRFDNGVVARRF
jgi:hypothetical protein